MYVYMFYSNCKWRKLKMDSMNLYGHDEPIENCFARIGTRFGSELSHDNPLGCFIPFVRIGFQKSTMIRYCSIFERKPTPGEKKLKNCNCF